VASITIDHAIPCDELLRALNARLKAGDIRIRSIEEMPDRWDARIFAKGKTYRYAIWNGARRARSSGTSCGMCRSPRCRPHGARGRGAHR
jgi:tRNA U38,U39,U40 pseudouridine synthase TruA